MSLNQFRTIGTRASALATAGVIGATAFLGAFPAAAEQLASKCGMPTQAGVQCAIREMDRRIDDNTKRAAAARARGSAADQEVACLDLIMADMANNGAKTASLTAVPPKGQACKAARDMKLVAGS